MILKSECFYKYSVGRQKVGNFGVGENWVKKVFDGNVALYIGQKGVKGDFLGQF